MDILCHRIWVKNVPHSPATHTHHVACKSIPTLKVLGREGVGPRLPSLGTSFVSWTRTFLSIDAFTKDEWRAIWVVRKDARRGAVGRLRRRSKGGGMAAEARSGGVSEYGDQNRFAGNVGCDWNLGPLHGSQRRRGRSVPSLN
jgi:hypothetical protein